eukprot:Skav229521  [mRNA]  locus=scaffold887:94153:95986:- [translate_table: standard]
MLMSNSSYKRCSFHQNLDRFPILQPGHLLLHLSPESHCEALRAVGPQGQRSSQQEGHHQSATAQPGEFTAEAHCCKGQATETAALKHVGLRMKVGLHHATCGCHEQSDGERQLKTIIAIDH